jgi:hypothetical protein
MVRYKWLLAAVLALGVLVSGALTRAAPDPEVARTLTELYTARAKALVTGQTSGGLDQYYDLDTQSGRNALTHEVGRIAYMQAWAPARQLKVTGAETNVTNLRVTVQGETARVSLITRTRLTYRYNSSKHADEMGIGSWHFLELSRKSGRWLVAKEFFLDALGDEWTQPYVPALAGQTAPVSGDGALSDSGDAGGAGLVLPAGGRVTLDRRGAAEYAEVYCGAAWGCGNNADYNSRFRSYKNLGGDCANFASQVLTEGGGLKPDWVWRHDSEGSTCWVNAQSFTQYLLGSGRASLAAKGTYAKVAPALGKLKPGDIVAYQAKGKITHVSVVTGIDSGGVPVVAAHTADRFRNPWDLGWDKDTVFWLLHLRE